MCATGHLLCFAAQFNTLTPNDRTAAVAAIRHVSARGQNLGFRPHVRGLPLATSTELGAGMAKRLGGDEAVQGAADDGISGAHGNMLHALVPDTHVAAGHGLPTVLVHATGSSMTTLAATGIVATAHGVRLQQPAHINTATAIRGITAVASGAAVCRHTNTAAFATLHHKDTCGLYRLATHDPVGTAGIDGGGEPDAVTAAARSWTHTVGVNIH